MFAKRGLLGLISTVSLLLWLPACDRSDQSKNRDLDHARREVERDQNPRDPQEHRIHVDAPFTDVDVVVPKKDKDHPDDGRKTQVDVSVGD